MFLVGQQEYKGVIASPQVLTKLDTKKELFYSYAKCVSVSDAISDLPKLVAGQNGNVLDYANPPVTAYQKLMRGELTAQEYLDGFRNG